MKAKPEGFGSPPSSIVPIRKSKAFAKDGEASFSRLKRAQ